MNLFEKLFVSLSMRKMFIDKFIFPKIFQNEKIDRYFESSDNLKILDLGCGSGEVTTLIAKYFPNAQITGVEIDIDLIERAKLKNNLANITYQLGDATNLKFENNTFDAVFVFGLFHHIPDWHKAVKELKRVLKNKGKFIIVDASIESYQGFWGIIRKKLFSHPYKNMYKFKEFKNYIIDNGLKIYGAKEYNSFGLYKYFVIYGRD